MSSFDWTAWQGMTFAVNPNAGRDGAVQVGPSHLIIGPRAYRFLLWEFEGRKTWEGRDWRRIKRERRKFVRKEPTS